MTLPDYPVGVTEFPAAPCIAVNGTTVLTDCDDYDPWASVLAPYDEPDTDDVKAVDCE